MGDPVTIAIGVASVIFKAKERKEVKKAKKAEEKAFREQKKQQDIQLRRERTRARRQSRIARAEAIAAGVTAGAGTLASGVQGAAGSAVSQLRGNLSFLDQLASSTAAELGFREEASRAQGAAASASALAGVAFDVFQARGGFGAKPAGKATTGPTGFTTAPT